MTGISAGARDVSPNDLLPVVHRRLRLVRPLAGQEVLHEAVLAVRIYPHRCTDCGSAKLPHHTEHLRWYDMVSCHCKLRPGLLWLASMFYDFGAMVTKDSILLSAYRYGAGA